jgi:phosphatidate phosphatase APP1
MTNQKSALLRVLSRIDSRLRNMQSFPRLRRGGVPRIVPYRGYGTPEVLHVRGRVLRSPQVRPAIAGDASWRNLLHVLRRLASDNVPGARVRARSGGVEWEGTADAEGYLDFRMEMAVPPDSVQGWHPVSLELMEPRPPSDHGTRATARVLIPPATAEFGVISDIDDTVIQTDVINLLRMARMVLLTNAHTRLPFEGVAAFYRALQEGRTGATGNPIFYVSSSPWNLYDLLEEVFEVHGVPAGPLFLKDYDLSREVLLSSGHHRHKQAAIRALFAAYPTLPWVLVGDSGQQDPEIYRYVVREHPGRVLAVYIRDVTSEQRDREVHAIAEEVSALGVEMLPVQNTTTAAAHAIARGFIRAEEMPSIQIEKAKDEAAPDPLESILE